MMSYLFNQQEQPHSIRRTMKIAVEACNFDGFSPLCSDGFEQPYRGRFPLLIELKDSLMINNYSSIYSIETLHNVPSLLYKDSVLSSFYHENNIIYFYDKIYKKKINKYLSKHKIKKKFSGSIYYYALLVDMEFKFQKKSNIILPDLSNGKNIIATSPCDMYIVDSIYSIKPIINTVNKYHWN